MPVMVEIIMTATKKTASGMTWLLVECAKAARDAAWVPSAVAVVSCVGCLESVTCSIMASGEAVGLVRSGGSVFRNTYGNVHKGV